ncbi:MAG: MarR family winged helix-turn-helix transcriptional regulator [Actinomycetes bacterium]
MDKRALGEDLITTSARLIRWAPKTGFRLSLAASQILARLQDNGPTRIGDLAAQERSSQPTITNHVKRLEAAGLVAREADPSDARAWMIELTDAGREELRSLRHTVGSNVEPFLADMSADDLQALRDGIDAMRRLMRSR